MVGLAWEPSTVRLYMTEYGYVHSCVILSRTDASQNEYGEVYTFTDSSQNTECRFYYSNSNSRIITPDSGSHAVSTPSVMLPGTVTVTQGNLITSTDSGFDHTFKVTATNPIYYLFYNTVHHWECDLEVVE